MCVKKSSTLLLHFLVDTCFMLFSVIQRLQYNLSPGFTVLEIFIFPRVMFACSVCKFRSFYKEEMEAHLESRFHKDHFKFLSGQLSKPTTDFLQVNDFSGKCQMPIVSSTH